MLFYLAKELGKTYEELMTGKPGPLSGVEFTQWIAWLRIRERIQRQQQSK